MEWVKKLYKNTVPTNARAFIKGAVGDQSPVDESYFKPDEIEALRKAVMRAQQGPYPKELDYVDYDAQAQNAKSLGDFIGTPDARMITTVGGARIAQDTQGNTVLNDHYDFNGEPASGEEALDGLKRNLTNGNIYGAARSLGSYFVPENRGLGYPVTVNLGKMK